MKKLKIIFLAVFLLVGISKVQAQDEDNKWAVSAGLNIVDITHAKATDVVNLAKDYLGPGDWNIGAPSISVSRYLNYGLSVKLDGSYNKLTTFLDVDGDDVNLYSFNLSGLYDLNNWFGETGWFDPYVFVGAGYTVQTPPAGNMSSITANAGLGFNSWLNDKWGISAMSGAYNPVTGDLKGYFQHSLGVIYKFGGPSKPDADGDGISDKKDLCPQEAGTKENGGCPDTDGDTILDKDDTCPNNAGTLENGGCPDTDEDTILDKDDSCPNKAGTVENGGCPDTDGDGIIDSKDKCPNEAGTSEEGGCLVIDTDGDGVADKDDQCPEVAGTNGKGGCAEMTEAQVSELLELSRTIGFKTGKDNYISGDAEKVDNLAKLMSGYPTTNFTINGYADITGSEAINLKISMGRAETVKAHLISKGIDANRLTTKGLGYEDPIASNKTVKGREENRRVEVIAE